ncbi:MAG: DNA topoisomerase III [Bermanella sp.]
MKLYIAEKPSLGRAIAAVLPKPHNKQPGYIELGNGDVVSWCIGHLLEQAEPDAYDAAYKSWKLEHLPIVPAQWQLQPKSQTRQQLSVLRKLVKKADNLVHAGDPDREGQLLVDEVIDYLGVKGSKKDSIQRLLINDLNPQAVQGSLNEMRSNQEFIPLCVSALCRSRADWLYGMNMTRAYTIQGGKAGYKGVLSVGRVQTPLLGLVVKRDQEIKAFISRDFYEVEAHIAPNAENKDNTIKLKWHPSDACANYQDEEGRLLHRPLAENVCARISGQEAYITRVEQKDKSQAAPLPFNLSTLQIEAAKKFGLSAKQVLDICQALYERHQLITYPRSDSRYLPEQQHKAAGMVINSIHHNCPSLTKFTEGANHSIKSKAFNDKKVDAHHAIIPSQKNMNTAQLSKQELQVYNHIARQYLMQFYPPYLFSETKLEATIAGGIFKTQARLTKSLGWKVLYGEDKKDKAPLSLPNIKAGEIWLCVQGLINDKKTQPPEFFTDATLLSAMTGISRYVQNKEIRKTLKETDGLGTEATRAGIIELLFKRKFLKRQGKQIHSTEVGSALINSLPESAITPDMTAQWENQLNAISEKQISYQGFMAPMNRHLFSLIGQAKEHIPQALQGVKSSHNPFSKKKPRKKSSTSNRKPKSG